MHFFQPYDMVVPLFPLHPNEPQQVVETRREPNGSQRIRLSGGEHFWPSERFRPAKIGELLAAEDRRQVARLIEDFNHRLYFGAGQWRTFPEPITAAEWRKAWREQQGLEYAMEEVFETEFRREGRCTIATLVVDPDGLAAVFEGEARRRPTDENDPAFGELIALNRALRRAVRWQKGRE
jgi:hypothetical protein